MNVRDVITKSLSLAGEQSFDAALQLLDAAIAEAQHKEESRALVLLTRNAGLIAERQGRFDAAERYYRNSLANDPADPKIHLALAGLCRSRGKEKEAKEFTEKARSLALERQDSDVIEILKKHDSEASGPKL